MVILLQGLQGLILVIGGKNHKEDGILCWTGYGESQMEKIVQSRKQHVNTNCALLSWACSG